MPQSDIYRHGWHPHARFRDAVCGRRFGKSFLGAAEMRRAAVLVQKWGVSPDDEIWYAAPTFKQAKRVFWRRLKRSIPAGMVQKVNETECYVLLKSEHIIRVVGLDSYDNLRGSGLFFVIVDEWADCPLEAWDEVLRPMLSTCAYKVDGEIRRGGHALRIGTPKGYNHCYDTFVMGQSEDVPDHKSWQFTSTDGGNIPQEEIDAAMRQLDRRTFDQEYRARFENFSGRVYYDFDRLETVRMCEYNPVIPVHIGMDFNVNPMSAVVCQEYPDYVVQVDEIVIPTSNTNEMAGEIKARYGDADVTVYPDPAGTQRRTSAQGETDIGILRKAGLKVNALDSHPLVRDRVNAVNSKIKSASGERHFFVDPRCKKTIECFEKMTYKEGTSEPDKLSGFDHLPDAFGYYVTTRWRINKESSGQWAF